MGSPQIIAVEQSCESFFAAVLAAKCAHQAKQSEVQCILPARQQEHTVKVERITWAEELVDYSASSDCTSFLTKRAGFPAINTLGFV